MRIREKSSQDMEDSIDMATRYIEAKLNKKWMIEHDEEGSEPDYFKE
jgi:hypothetical protein